MISHHAHLHQDEAKDFECLIVVGLAHARSLKPIFEKTACVLFISGCSASGQMLGVRVLGRGSECMQEVLRRSNVPIC